MVGMVGRLAMGEISVSGFGLTIVSRVIMTFQMLKSADSCDPHLCLGSSSDFPNKVDPFQVINQSSERLVHWSECIHPLKG